MQSAGAPRGTQGKLDAALRQVLGRRRSSGDPAGCTLVFIDPGYGPPASLEEICAVRLRRKLVEQAAQLLELKRQVGLHAFVAAWSLLECAMHAQLAGALEQPGRQLVCAVHGQLAGPLQQPRRQLVCAMPASWQGPLGSQGGSCWRSCALCGTILYKSS